MKCVVTIITHESKRQRIVEAETTVDAVEDIRKTYILGADSMISAMSAVKYQELFGTLPTQ